MKIHWSTGTYGECDMEDQMLTRFPPRIVKYHSFLRKATRFNRSRGGEIPWIVGGGI